MQLFHSICSIAKADFLERIRRSSFLIISGLTVWASSIFIPPTDSLTGMHVELGGYRGFYNSAWIGATSSICTIMFLSLLGFYLVKNSIDRDKITRVGQIIAATPISNYGYLIGKLLSNFLVLSLIVAITAISGGVMQFVRGEDLNLHIWNLVSPFLIIALPAMFAVSTIAVIFECIPPLSGTFGNVLYSICLWPAMLVACTRSQTLGSTAAKLLDPLGILIPVNSMTPTIKSVYPEYNGSFRTSITTLQETLKVFQWNGIEWTSEIVLMRLFWIVVSFVVIFFVSLFFNRFNPSLTKTKPRQKSKISLLEQLSPEKVNFIKDSSAANLTKAEKGFSFLAVLRAELTFTLKKCPKLLLLIILILIFVSVKAPIQAVRNFIFPILLIVPISLWSDLGSREKIFNTRQLVFSSPSIIRNQLAARYLVGILVTLIIVIGFGIREMTSQNTDAAIALFSCIVFIPALSLCFGIWSGTSRMFEVVYTTLWYFGPFNKMPALDFTHIVTDTYETVTIYFVVTLLMFVLSIMGRKKQVYDSI